MKSSGSAQRTPRREGAGSTTVEGARHSPEVATPTQCTPTPEVARSVTVGRARDSPGFATPAASTGELARAIYSRIETPEEKRMKLDIDMLRAQTEATKAAAEAKNREEWVGLAKDVLGVLKEHLNKK